MISVSYDLHLHSCLSPCGSDDMTPNNIVNMALLLELDVIALTDHNTCGNCPAVMEVARRNGLLALPGMELTTSEDIHILCLFPNLEKAQRFEEEVKARSNFIPNRPEIFGRQILMDANDIITAEYEPLLIFATEISSSETPALVRSYGGIALPAHIDKPANSILATLGDLPPDHGFLCAEMRDLSRAEDYRNRYNLGGVRLISNSDAHMLADMSTGENRLHVEKLTASAVIATLAASMA